MAGIEYTSDTSFCIVSVTVVWEPLPLCPSEGQFAFPHSLIFLVCLLRPIAREDRAQENIDKLLTDAGWIAQDSSTNLAAGKATGIDVDCRPSKQGARLLKPTRCCKNGAVPIDAHKTHQSAAYSEGPLRFRPSGLGETSEELGALPTF